MTGNSYSLQPYLGAGILHAGANLLSVEVAGQKITAGGGLQMVEYWGLALDLSNCFQLFLVAFHPSHLVSTPNLEWWGTMNKVQVLAGVAKHIVACWAKSSSGLSSGKTLCFE